LDFISDLTEEILETDAAIFPPDPGDYRTHASRILTDILRIHSASLDATEWLRSARLNAIMGRLPARASALRIAASHASTGVAEEADILSLLSQLEAVLKDLSAQSDIRTAVEAVNSVRRSVASALSTDVIADPAAALRLPVRFHVHPPLSDQPIGALKSEIDTTSREANAASQQLLVSLKNPRSPSATILSSISAFERALTAVTSPTAALVTAAWNPHSQKQADAAAAGLIALGDTALDAARARLNASAGWPGTVAQFGAQSGIALEKAVTAAAATLAAAQADLCATNAAEKGLIALARAVADGQGRFTILRKVSPDIVDLTSPVLRTTAKFVEIAREQTQILLRRDGSLPNQTALLGAADDFLKGLLEILAGVEATAAGNADAPGQLLAGANASVEAVVKLAVEAQQKGGSRELNQMIFKLAATIRNWLVQVKSFAEIAIRAKEGIGSPVATREPRNLSGLLELFYAETRVVETRKALEFAELCVKRLKEEAT
jgi:hypothetical protein